VALKIINMLGGRLREAVSRLRDLAGERVEQRIAGILLMLNDKLGPELPFTRQDIADMSGTTVETAIRTMSRLTEDGVIRSARGKITVINRERLSLLSQTAA
jgi:CRP/FNR family transcriptional regulator